jgi:hypothetical protein
VAALLHARSITRVDDVSRRFGLTPAAYAEACLRRTAPVSA